MKLKADPTIEAPRGTALQQVSSWSHQYPSDAKIVIKTINHHMFLQTIDIILEMLNSPVAPTEGFFTLGCMHLYAIILSYVAPYDTFDGQPVNIYSLMGIKENKKANNSEQGPHKKKHCSHK
jgi:hypothetical protein